MSSSSSSSLSSSSTLFSLLHPLSYGFWVLFGSLTLFSTVIFFCCTRQYSQYDDLDRPTFPPRATSSEQDEEGRRTTSTSSPSDDQEKNVEKLNHGIPSNKESEDGTLGESVVVVPLESEPEKELPVGDILPSEAERLTGSPAAAQRVQKKPSLVSQSSSPKPSASPVKKTPSSRNTVDSSPIKPTSTPSASPHQQKPLAPLDTSAVEVKKHPMPAPVQKSEPLDSSSSSEYQPRKLVRPSGKPAPKNNVDALLEWTQLTLEQLRAFPPKRKTVDVGQSQQDGEMEEKIPIMTVTNFTTCFKDGLVFCALIYYWKGPSALLSCLKDADKKTISCFADLSPNEPERNLTLAFDAAEKLGVSRLLDVEDITEMNVPDRQSIITYLSDLYAVLMNMPKDRPRI